MFFSSFDSWEGHGGGPLCIREIALAIPQNSSYQTPLRAGIDIGPPNHNQSLSVGVQALRRLEEGTTTTASIRHTPLPRTLGPGSIVMTIPGFSSVCPLRTNLGARVSHILKTAPEWLNTEPSFRFSKHRRAAPSLQATVVAPGRTAANGGMLRLQNSLATAAEFSRGPFRHAQFACDSSKTGE